ncbi:hypothetical protein CEP52_013832 [Fusarium oligoseptatum]|uniref:SGNH hydrolase-type esterase domain-containing protein n=1 Tax=Fusarium oligoseptatum TaxID=2604345 RepID=A0A428SRL7_9HYPO|nr:hypothetical protein CEP52_013832 [Fusarium oligoseptatum]
MALSAHGRRLNAWTGLTLLLVALSSWIPVSNASVPSPRHLHRREAIAKGVELRVLPIGDSITWGARSSDENGYRKYLWDRLAQLENKVDFVGMGYDNRRMSDPDHEGHRGKVIDEISTLSSVGISAAPNIVLLHAGTNDMNKPVDPEGAPARLKNLINKILKVSPKAVVLVCQLVPSTKLQTTQPRIKAFNDAIPSLVEELKNEGKRVIMVSMNDALELSDIDDDLHPNDEGYEKMAVEFTKAILLASSMNWISEPGTPVTPTGSSSADRCKSTPSWYSAGTIATGAKVATSDSSFHQRWSRMGPVHDGDCPRDRIHFMDLDGDGFKDLACVEADTGKTKVMMNIPDGSGKGGMNWRKAETMASGKKGRLGAGVRFADLNGDGRDDYIYVHPITGDVSAWINRGKGEGDAPWQWQSIGVIAEAIGATQKNLQFVDLNGEYTALDNYSIPLPSSTFANRVGHLGGDRRADLCLVNQESGEVKAWINNGAGIMPDWYRLDTIATGASKAANDSVILADFTGEGRADYMMVGADAKVVGFINRLQEETIAPKWSLPVVVAEGPGETNRESIRLADVTGDGKADYLRMGKDGKFEVWENVGRGGKYQAGEGVFLCDLDGDGASDYFWIDHEGSGWAYLNKGRGSNAWDDLGQIMKNNPHPRESIRMARLTKSGRADYIVVDDDIGQAWFWQNLGPKSDWSWGSQAECAAGPKATIKRNWGWNFYPRNVRFADLNKDGLDDYIYMNNDGATVWWENLGTIPITWGPATLVADGPEGVIPQDVHFADTNGDGLLDYVVVGRVTGKTRTWHNLGFRKEDGSIRWNTPLSFADRTKSTGSAIKIADMTGDGRADYMSMNPENGRLEFWHNRCWPLDESSDGGSSGGSDQDSWKDITCEHPSVVNYTLPAADRWKDIRCDEAWEDALDNWRSMSDTGLGFSAIISGYFKMNEGKNCGNMVEENNCYQTEKCDEKFGGAAPFLVMNSLVSLSQTLWNMINLFGDAGEAIKGDIGLFAKTFAPPEREDGVGLYVILDIVAMGYAGILAPFWSRWAQKVNWSKRNPNDFNTAKDIINDETYQAITIAKDLITLESKDLEAENLLANQISAIMRAWTGGMKSYATRMFNGSEASIKQLSKLMASGKLIDLLAQLGNATNIDLELKKTLYGMMVPMAWRVAGRDLNPFILDSGLSCKDAPNDEYITNVLSEDTRKKRLICDKGKNRGYYLVGAVDPPDNCPKAGWEEETAECKDFEDLPGSGELGTRVGQTDKEANSGTQDWGLLSVEDIVFGSLATFKANGYKNVGEGARRGEWNSLDQWEKTLGDLVDNDIRAPYFFDLPVCNAIDAFLNYKTEGEGETSKKNRKYYFPCNEVIDWDSSIAERDID